MKAKEDEFNSIIMDLRKYLEALQQKLAKKEIDKLEALDSLGREKEARLAVERLQASLLEDLQKSKQENATSNQKLRIEYIELFTHLMRCTSTCKSIIRVCSSIIADFS